ncbi:Do family serine endopeptidase [Maricaulis salignorans]|uniref:Probable periplasmic serine endoprotease DegP-like n=1 Tax=Maricaulis salignorans TaxID=144026 RepID=A0A1G9Q0Z6_9PROT|nr:Do family serine endopeptidase [Maricaulis salignorans]SDM04690.1 serine protease Do [Maricaulis salignorans]
MLSVSKIRRLGGVSVLVLAALAAGSLLNQSIAPAHAMQAISEPNFAAAIPAGAPMSFADLIEHVSPAVVTIQASSTPDEAPAGVDLDNMPPQMREWLERQFGGRAGPQAAQPRQSLGSGFFISADGYLVTNNHVVDGATEITIGTAGGETYPARVIGLDPQTDLALLKVDEEIEFPFVTLEDQPHYRVGDWVVAVGNPFGLGGTATAGIISATGREIGNSNYNDFLQIDAPINRGNSGGPTFSLDGKVVGVNSQIFSPTGGSVGIGFAIPSDVAARVVAALRENGHVSRGWLGVGIQNVTEDIASAMGLEESTGAIISSVVAGGPADQAGFEREDVVLAVNDESVENSRDLTRRIGEFSSGTDVRFRVLRDGRERTLRVELGERPDDSTLNQLPSREQAEASVDIFGMTLSELSDEVRDGRGLAAGTVGLVIESLEPGGEASRKGLSRGDIILEAGGRAVGTTEALRDAINAARAGNRNAILLLVETQAGQRYIALQLGEAE